MATTPAVKRNGIFINVGTDVRIEAGPARQTAKATDELLSNDVTAEHYQPGLADADGRIIEHGKPMTYLDWKGAPGFYVYLWEPLPNTAPEDGGPWHPDGGVFRERGFFPTEDDAVTFAKTIAAK